jgi:hypothetical protein
VKKVLKWLGIGVLAIVLLIIGTVVYTYWDIYSTNADLEEEKELLKDKHDRNALEAVLLYEKWRVRKDYTNLKTIAGYEEINKWTEMEKKQNHSIPNDKADFEIPTNVSAEVYPFISTDRKISYYTYIVSLKNLDVISKYYYAYWENDQWFVESLENTVGAYIVKGLTPRKYKPEDLIFE